MKKNAAFALSALLIGMGFVAAAAQADELVASNVLVQLVNRQSVMVADLIPSDLTGLSLRTLMIIASSNDQRDNPSGPNGTALDIFVNGRLFASDLLRSNLGTYQVALRGVQGASSIELRARSVSGVKLAMVGLTIDNAYNPQPQPQPLPQDPRDGYGSSMEFRGRFGSAGVFFTGRDAAELNQDCQTYMARSSNSSIDSIQVNSSTYTNSSSYWNKNQLCAIAALNANVMVRGQLSPVLTAGKVGIAPFSIQAQSIEEATKRIQTYIPLAVGSNTDTIDLNGAHYVNSSTYWSAAELMNMVSFSYSKVAGGLAMKGLIGVAPFTFGGYTGAEVRDQCRAYMAGMSSSSNRVDRVQVNGRTSTNQSSYWNAEDVCMIIASEAGGGVMQPMPPR